MAEVLTFLESGPSARLGCSDEELSQPVQSSEAACRSSYHPAPCLVFDHLYGEEKMTISKNQLIWSACGRVIKRCTTQSPIMQVCKCTFKDYEELPVTCILQRGLLLAVTMSGQVEEVPLPLTTKRLWPVPNGVILESSSAPPSLLRHPLDEITPVAAANVSPEMQHLQGLLDLAGHRLLWSCSHIPVIATQHQGRVTVMSQREVDLDNQPQVAASLSPKPPPAEAAMNAGSRSVRKRLPIRDKRGHMSPHIFGTFARCPPAEVASAQRPWGPLMDQENIAVWTGLTSHNLPPGSSVGQAGMVFVHEPQAAAPRLAVLCLLAMPQGEVRGICLQPHGGVSSAAMLHGAASIAPVAALCRGHGAGGRHAGWGAEGGWTRCSDEPSCLLTLMQDGRLLLLQAVDEGRSAALVQLCEVTVPADALAVHPCFRSPQHSMPLPVGDAMDQDTDDTPCSPSPVALEQPVGQRVTICCAGGHRRRATVAAIPFSRLAGAALAVLREFLPQPLFQTIHRAYLHQPGSCSGDPLREWAVFSGLIDALISQAAPPARTPAASVAPSAPARAAGETGSAWERLLSSPEHRVLEASRLYRWLAPSCATQAAGPPAAAAALQLPAALHRRVSAAELQTILQALHGLHEDLRLNMLFWKDLQPLASVLSKLAAACQLPEFQEYYMREGSLHPDAVLPTPPAAGAGAHPGLVGDLYAALALLLEGSKQRALQQLPAVLRPWYEAGSGTGRPGPAACRQYSALWRSTAVLDLYMTLCDCAVACRAITLDSLATACSKHEQLHETLLSHAHRMVKQMVDLRLTLADLEVLAPGVALPLHEIIAKVRSSPPSSWPAAAYILIGRDDIASSRISVLQPPLDPLRDHHRRAPAPSSPATTPGGRLPFPQATPAAPHGGNVPLGTPPATPKWSPLPLVLQPGSSRTMAAASASPLSPSAALLASKLRSTSGGRSPGSRSWLSTSVWMPFPAAHAGRFTKHQLLRLPYMQRLQVPLTVRGGARPLPTLLVGGHLGEAAAAPPPPVTACIDGEAGLSVSDKPRDAPVVDGMEGLTEGRIKLRFGRDLRLKEVRRLFSTAHPVWLTEAETGSHPSTSRLQMVLMTHAMRSMALAIGRGAFALGTAKLLPTEVLEIPRIDLSGRLPETGAVVSIDLSSFPAAQGGGATVELTAWPEFHNGVATALRLSRMQSQLARTWIAHQRMQQHATYMHAGELLGLGLMGHLTSLSPTDVFKLLRHEHDPTTVGLLLGLAACKKGSMDPEISRTLFLHIPARHPTTFPELELPPLVQAAALMGLGLLYEGSGHRPISEILLQEIGRRPGTGGIGEGAGGGSQGGTVPQDREGYALAAGLALGLIHLGKGRSALGVADLQLEARLRYFMLGGMQPCGASAHSSSGHHHAFSDPSRGFSQGLAAVDPLLSEEWGCGTAGTSHRTPCEDSAHAAGSSLVVLEGSLVNLEVTSPAATMALALMYLRTNDADISAYFAIPDTRFALDYVRPDLILLRLLARCLVMWDDISATQEWVESQLPEMMRLSLTDIQARAAQSVTALDGEAEHVVDYESIGLAHINIIAAACLAIGLKYAGSANRAAAECVRHFLLYFLDCKRQVQDIHAMAMTGFWTVDKQALESCLGLCAIALSLVLAGTGHLPTLKLLRSLRMRLHQSHGRGLQGMGNLMACYSAHMCLSTALGFLMLGGGTHTFGTSNNAIAALVIALFPKFPDSPCDNRCHLQAFRHLYVLAAERRVVEAVDVDTQQPVFSPVQITVALNDPQLRPPPASGDTPDVLEGACPGRWLEGTDLEVLERMCPCLLPEASSVSKVEIQSPRYWGQDLGWECEGEEAALAALYARGVVFIKKKAGALSYADDPSGVRSLLSRAFRREAPRGVLLNASAATLPQPRDESQEAQLQPAGGSGNYQNSFDLVHLVATFAADPFIMGFAQHFCSSLPGSDVPHAPWRALGVPGSSAPAPPPQCATLQSTHAFQGFCRGVLYECVANEKPHVLQSYLFLFLLLQMSLGPQLMSEAHPPPHAAPHPPSTPAACAAQGGWGLASLCGAPGLGLGMRSLQQLLQFYRSLLGGHTIPTAAAARTDPWSNEVWEPLVQGVFLEGLWLQVQLVWARLGLLPESRLPAGVQLQHRAPQPQPQLPSACVLQQCLRSGCIPAAQQLVQQALAGSVEDGQWVRQVMGSCLTLLDLPPCPQLLVVVQQHIVPKLQMLRSTWQPALKAQPGQTSLMQQALMLPLLHEQLPHLPPTALLVIASCLSLML